MATTASRIDEANPPAGDGAIVYFSDRMPPGEPVELRERGDFEIVSRPGGVSLYAIAGICRMRDGVPVMVEAAGIGWRHFLSTAPGDELEGQDISVDTPLRAEMDALYDQMLVVLRDTRRKHHVA